MSSSYVFTLSTFYRLLATATIFFPAGAAHFAEMIASVRRIQQYLENDDFVKIQNSIEHKSGENTCNGEVELLNVTAKWPGSSLDTIRGINLKVQSGGLIAITGASGSGKTTLLNLMLQELQPIEGCVKASGTISYASQEPWLFGETLRENILFGEPYKEKKYDEVIKICALDRDFKALQFGDGTLTGDRGLSLSGGQRARINLARAIYREADIYLLDDPLSAVDNRVGKHIYEKGILEYLENKTVVLVTHQIQYLKNLDSIYLLKDGSLKQFKSISEMREEVKEFFHDLGDILNQPEEEQESNVIAEEEESKPIKNEAQKLIKEERGSGKISGKVYKLYFLACGHWFGTFLMVSLFLVAQILDSFSEYFLSFW